MRAVAVTQPNRVEMVDLPVPEPGRYQALVKTEVAYLCNATDGKLVAGHFPGVEKYPLVLGHESAGIVQAVGERVRNFRKGDRAIGGLVFEFADPRYASGWGGFCEYTLVNDHEAMVEDGVADEKHGWFESYEIQRAVDSDIPVEEAALLCTWREVLAAFDDFNLKRGDDVLVFGGGPVGLSFVKFARLLGLGFVGMVDPHEEKRERARQMGADEAFLPDSDLLNSLANKRGKPLDAVVDAVGSAAIVSAALPLIRMAGTVGVYGVIADESITIEKSRGPYNFNLFVHQWPTRSREAAAQKPLCEWIRAGKLKASEFMTHEFPVESINEALATVKSGKALKVLLRY